ncbi:MULTISPECIES: DUF4247 domain-containing protein [unclassified Streptomyces]|uniref:DUF4247 domain-containing protein n=1 Tax=unclassified Streptomyces TaxID=2593676 RepID=UPI003D73DF76
MKSTRPVRAAAAAVAAMLAAVLLTACSGGSDTAVPRGWIADTYTVDAGGWRDRDSVPGDVADAIDDHSHALDRASGDSMEFLRYGDDMVTVSPYRNGSLIQIEDYRNGYNRHSQHLSHWPNPYSESFRGGGPGTGK